MKPHVCIFHCSRVLTTGASLPYVNLRNNSMICLTYCQKIIRPTVTFIECRHTLKQLIINTQWRHVLTENSDKSVTRIITMPFSTLHSHSGIKEPSNFISYIFLSNVMLV